MSILSAGALALALWACQPQVQDTSLVISSDPDLRNRVAELLPVLARRAGMELDRPIRAERRSRQELEAYLIFKLDQELPPREARVRTRSYELLGMVDPGFDLREVLLSVYTEQVAGFYDPDSTALFVMEDMPVEMLETVLVHELVHAVQDQTADLDSLTAMERGNDRQVAAQSAIEGHATLIMLEHMAETVQGEPVDLSTLPDVSAAIRPAMEAMRDQYPALASAPVLIQESLLFPYVEGASYLAELWHTSGTRPPPFGAYLPQSTEQILNPEVAPGAAEDPPTELALAVEAGVTVLYENTLGQLEVGIFLDELLGVGNRGLAQGWDGDRFLLLEGPGGEEGLLWVTVWDGARARDDFAAAVSGGLSALPLAATLESAYILGRPGTILRVGLEPSFPVQARAGKTNTSDVEEEG